MGRLQMRGTCKVDRFTGWRRWLESPCWCRAAAGGAKDGDFDPAFVAGFGQANVGDTSPNILGAFCQDTGVCLADVTHLHLVHPEPYGKHILVIESAR